MKRNKIKKFLKKAVCTVLLCTVCAMFTGCWDKRELNELAIVLGVAIDKSEDGKISLIAQIARNSNKQGGNVGGDAMGDFSNIAYEGKDVFETLRRMTTVSSRQMYNSHNQLVLFEKEIAEEGMYDYIDFFARDNEFRYTMWLVISEGKASEIFNASTQYDNVPTTELSQLISMQELNSLNIQTNILDFVKAMSEENGSILLPMVHLEEMEIGEKQEESSSGGEGGSVGGISQSGGETSGESGENGSDNDQNGETGSKNGETSSTESSGKKVMKISKAAVIKESKMVGEIDEQAIRGFLWCSNKVDSTIIVANAEKSSSNVEIFRAKGGYKVTLNSDGSITVEVTVNAEGMLGQLTGGYDEAGNQLLNELEKACCGVIEQEINEAFGKAKEYNADFIGVGTYLDRHSHSEWKAFKDTDHWEEYLQNVNVVTHVNVSIESTGALNIGEDVI